MKASKHGYWAASSIAWLTSRQESLSLFPSSASHISTYVCCLLFSHHTPRRTTWLWLLNNLPSWMERPPPPKPSLLQAEQTQFPWPLLTGLMLQPPDPTILGVLLLNLHYSNVSKLMNGAGGLSGCGWGYHMQVHVIIVARTGLVAPREPSFSFLG